MIIRPIHAHEIDTVAGMISAGYFCDKFFHWVVEDDADRLGVVAEYYKVYLRAAGCVSHVAEDADGTIVGATVWLPDDVDASIYDEINAVVGKYAPNFQAVADASHDNEPDERPFHQLVGFVVDERQRGRGIGAALLKFHLDVLDAQGIPTYLEASTPYHGGGVYGRFGYEMYSPVMTFAEGAILYPLWRGAITPHDSIVLDAN